MTVELLPSFSKKLIIPFLTLLNNPGASSAVLANRLPILLQIDVLVPASAASVATSAATSAAPSAASLVPLISLEITLVPSSDVEMALPRFLDTLPTLAALFQAPLNRPDVALNALRIIPPLAKFSTFFIILLPANVGILVVAGP